MKDCNRVKITLFDKHSVPILNEEKKIFHL